MNFFKKYILFLFLLSQITIKSAYMFKKADGNLRNINGYHQKSLEDLDSKTIPSEEIILGIGPNDEYAKFAFLEEKANGRYQVHYFTLLNPKKSEEFKNKEDAQLFLKIFMLSPIEEVASKRSYFVPLPARGKGQGWRSTSSRTTGRRK